MRLFAIILLGVAWQAQAEPEPVQQPIPFSHKVHAGDLKVPCKNCHTSPDPGEMMTFPAASKCMQCHAAIKADSPAIQKVAAAAKENREIPWVRVYQIPAYVNFSHRDHLESGSTCQDCHGQVATRAQLFKEGDITMGACMNCHRQKKASIDCGFCHEPR